MKELKKIFLLVGLTFLLGMSFLMAQQYAWTPQLVTEDIPETGTFYLLSSGIAGQYVPYPYNPYSSENIPVYLLPNGNYLVMDESTEEDNSNTEEAIARIIACTTSSSVEGYTANLMQSLKSLQTSMPRSESNQLYFTNVTASDISSNSIVMNFDIEGSYIETPIIIWSGTCFTNNGTNIVPCFQNWYLQGVGYVGQNYTFTNNSPSSYYTMSIPSKMGVIGWGNNKVGQCDIPSNITNATMVAAGGGQSLTLLKNGTICAWGQNSYGQGSVPNGLSNVISIAAGWYHNVALLENGTIRVWGNNHYQQTNVSTNLSGIKKISANALHSLALKEDGTVIAWGHNTSSGETNVPIGLSNVSAISAGFQHNLALSNGTVVAWGNNVDGRCSVPLGLTNVVAIAAGVYHSLALKDDGTVVAWGGNNHGECDIPTGLNDVISIAVGGEPFFNDTSSYSLALKKGGTLVKWGDGEVVSFGGLCQGITAIAAEGHHALAIRPESETAIPFIRPKLQYKPIGQNAIFNCTNIDYGKKVNLQWQHNGSNIVSATNPILTLYDIQPSDHGIYRIIANSGQGITYAESELRVVLPPIITEPIPAECNQLICFGESITLGATGVSTDIVHGFPLSYQWLSNGTNISRANDDTYQLSGFFNNSRTYTLSVSNASGSSQHSWYVRTTNDGPNAVVEGTLAYHLVTNAVAKASGKTLASNGLLISNWEKTNNGAYNNANSFLNRGQLFWNTNCWIQNPSGLTATSIGGEGKESGLGLVTMVSPIHYVRSSHISWPIRSNFPGSRFAFLDSSNRVLWRQVAEALYLTNNVGSDTDIAVGIFTNALPSSVGYIKVLPTNFSTFLPTNEMQIVQCIGMNQFMRVFGQPITFTHPKNFQTCGVSWNPKNEVPLGLDTSWNVELIDGDSSAPERLLIENELVLCSMHWASYAGPSIAEHYDLINDAMQELSISYNMPVYSLTPFSLSTNEYTPINY